MIDAAEDKTLWAIVTIGKELFAIRLQDIQTMVALPPVTALPRAPACVRGVMNLRGSVVPVVDLRKRLGMVSLPAEMDDLISMLNKREEDHKNWLTELESSIRDKRGFGLETDPHKCAFGQWYDHFKTDKLILASLLKKFDAPHRKIHAIANTVLALQKDGKHDQALKSIDDTRNGALLEMVQLFASLRLTLKESLREIAIVGRREKNNFAVIVDAVETVSLLERGSIEPLANNGIHSDEDGLVTSFGKLEKSGKLVMILDLSNVFKQVGEVDACLDESMGMGALP